MISRTNIGGLQVANSLKKLIHAEILPGLDISPGRFWDEFEQLIIEFAPKNASLLVKRDELQQKIDAWHQQRAAQAHDPVAYKAYLQEIGYLLPEGEDFMINTQNIDSEIATQAGPQLVVPVKNARFALNAANARWGSLYDALYGTDVIPETNGAERAGSYNKVRGDKVIAFARRHLDVVAPLLEGSHARVSRYTVQDVNPTKDFELEIYMSNGKTTSLRHPERFIAYRGDRIQPEAILLKNNA
ncbi:MAG: malate synthase G, partial [Gammaproteobacteria bacterium]|nr:malate synthase G [Gammaproteobacteria bacterium]